MRKFVYSLLCALLLTSSLVAPALAQDAPFTPPVLCGDLDASDCSILEASAEAMQSVTAYAFDIEYKAFVTGLPEMEIENVEITFGANGMIEIDPDVVAAMQELTAASMSGDADNVAAAMEDMTAILLDFYAGLNFDGQVYFSMPEELAALLSEDSDVPMPPDLTMAFRIIDGMFYMQISEFKSFAPELEEIPADWIGFDMVGLMEQSMAQSEGGEFDVESMTAGLVGTGLAYQLISAMEPFVTVERLDAGRRPARGCRGGPLGGGDDFGRVRGVLQRVVVVIHAPFGLSSISLNLLADLDHRLTEAVQLGQRLALGRLDHQRAGHGERQRRRVEAVVHQPLGDVLGRRRRRVLQRARVDDALVGDAAVGAFVEHRVVRLQPLGHVVGVQDRDLRRRSAPAAHHGDVGVGDGQDAGAAPRRAETCPAPLRRPRRPPPGWLGRKGARCSPRRSARRRGRRRRGGW
jgi:hypothetical protein